jgi:tRNA(Arg) A34 adenosine deaminase TadA
VVALRAACSKLKRFHLDECELYTSCEPCPMCLGALYWARIGKIYYANTRKDAARIAFDDALIYREIGLPLARRRIPMKQMMRREALEVFQAWQAKIDRIDY